MTTDASKRILVTGGSAGIGLALCHQLVVEDGCHVYLGSRSLERGQAAVASIDAVRPAGCSGFVELVHLDVGDADSVSAAVDAVRASLGPNGSLYGLVNNAGTGLATGASPDEVVNTNLFGVKRMCDAFLEAGLVSSRIVNVGSGSGPGYVRRCPLQTQPALCKAPADWAAIESQLARSEDGMSGFGSSADVNGGYGISKALVALYTMLCARMHPEITSSCVSPGWIKTKLVGDSGATKRPEEGTVSIRHCLFQPLEGNGWYYGSDAVRSPLHFMRNPGEPAYDGVVDGVVGVA
jgi:NAD(P)-dependent dehydrogenase (short-subunit alcohol dehydrogenase family)